MKNILNRSQAMRSIEIALAENPVCALMGPRQCGKTTLARELASKEKAHYFDLESASARSRLEHTPELVLGELRG